MAKRAAAPVESETLSNAVIQKHIRLCSDARTKLEEANGIYRAALKTAKSAGCNQRQIIAVMTDRKKDPDAIIAETRDYIRYAGLVGIKFVQGDLFPKGVHDVSAEAAAEQEDWQIEEAGLTAGKSGAARGDNRHPPGSAQFAAWDKGYLRGQAAIASAMGKNAKMASTRRSRTKPGGEATLLS